jgi:hypothetical protein
LLAFALVFRDTLSRCGDLMVELGRFWGGDEKLEKASRESKPQAAEV